MVIEQAKGIIAERERVSLDEAFQRIRVRARNTNRTFRDVARDVVATGLRL